MFNGYGQEQWFCFYNNGSSSYKSYGLITDQQNLFIKTAGYAIGNETNLVTNWTPVIQFGSAGQMYVSNEFNMQSIDDDTNKAKYFDVGFQDNSFSMRRTTAVDGGHANFIHVNSSNVVSGDFNDTSDEKLKKNIVSIADGAIADIKKLRPVTFDWIDDMNRDNVSGFIAQEMKTVLPNIIDGEEYDPTPLDADKGIKGGIKGNGYSVNTNGLVAHLTKALQEAITEIETLKTKVAALESA